MVEGVSMNSCRHYLENVVITPDNREDNPKKNNNTLLENKGCSAENNFMECGHIYDITQTIKADMPQWLGDPPVALQTTFYGGTSLTGISMSAHSGTHVDAPCHMLHGGVDASQLSLEQMCGMAKVCDIGNVEIIDSEVLIKLNLVGVKRLLLKTSNSVLLAKPNITPQYVHLTVDAAQYLVDMKIMLLAVDYLSVDAFDSCDYPVHRILLEAGIIIVEGVDLSGVPSADYELLCLPLKMTADGAPARVILRSI